jgi:GNAT superfamily N-acetyltransferase
LEKPGTSVAYTQVSKLPGRPFWHLLNDPLHLLLYLNRYGAKKLLRWRIRDKGLAVYAMGKKIVYYFVKPRDLPPGYLDEICLIIEAGGSVDTALVRYNLERAFLIGYAMEHGVIVGNSSLKRPRAEYVEAVNRQSGLDLSNYLERGYTSVRPEYRGMGIGAKLLEGLTERVGDIKLFSIISSDNVAAQKMALRNRTRQVATFYSKKLGKEVGVWMPEWMIED